jgi:glyoxylase-like metal-dependent hydrolase (beta-lactamase superfamily II)/ferredoxin
LSKSAPGEFGVDASCIDCDLCRQIAPSTFVEGHGQAVVGVQPRDAAERRRALIALVTCPTASITCEHDPDVREAARALPEPIIDDVFFCGYASADAYGASSYLIRRDGGNVLVDSPRAARPLSSRLEELGGVRTMFLTHRDDVADHAFFRRRTGCERVLHRRDLTRDTAGVERVLDGDEPVSLAEDLLAIPVPGHTRGSTALLYRRSVLFTGDHLWSDDGSRLDAGRSVCWYSWTEQVRSMERLLTYPFEWVLPGHGRRLHRPAPIMRAEVEDLIRRMR